MRKNKLSCSEFIVATLRKLRRNPKNLPDDANSGMSLKRLWEVAKEIYSKDEFRNGLEDLLAQNTILITARQYGGGIREIAIRKIPDDIGNCDRWHLSEQGKYVSPTASESLKHRTIANFLVYVQADGLPKKAKRIQKVSYKQATAQAIIEETTPPPPYQQKNCNPANLISTLHIGIYRDLDGSLQVTSNRDRSYLADIENDGDGEIVKEVFFTKEDFGKNIKAHDVLKIFLEINDVFNDSSPSHIALEMIIKKVLLELLPEKMNPSVAN